MQVKCLRVLQYFPPPPDPAVRRSLTEMLQKIIKGALEHPSITLSRFVESCIRHVSS